LYTSENCETFNNIDHLYQGDRTRILVKL